MNREQILENIKILSRNQGYYERIYEKLIDGSKESEDELSQLENKHIKDVFELVFYLSKEIYE